jgi:tetratricopeptide (TPR) repeat protein
MSPSVSTEHAQLLRLLTTQLERDAGFELVFLFGDDERSFDWLKREIAQVLASRQKILVPLGCSSEDDLAFTLQALLNHILLAHHTYQPMWIYAGINSKLIKKLLGRMNERRQQLSAQARPIYVCLPRDAELQLATLAPDLWSIRSLALIIPSFTANTSEQSMPNVKPTRLHPAVPLIYYPLWQRAATKYADNLTDSALDLGLGLSTLNELLEQSAPIDVINEVLLQIEMYFPQLPKGLYANQLEQALFFALRGDFDKKAGNITDALTAYKKGIKIREKILTSVSKNTDLKRDLAVSHDQIASIFQISGKTDEALDEYQKSLEIRKDLVLSNPNNVDWQRDLSVSYERSGDVLLSLGKYADVLLEYQKSLEIRERLVAIDPENIEWQRDLSVSYEKLADILRMRGEFVAAFSKYLNSLKISEALVAANPENNYLLRDLSVSYEKVGDSLKEQHLLTQAFKSYSVSMQIRERLVHQDIKNTDWQRDLSVSFERIADIYQAQLDHANALKYYQVCINIREKLVASDFKNIFWQRELSVGYSKLADVLEAQGETKSAFLEHEKSLKISEKLATADPENIDWQIDLVVRYYKLGLLYFKTKSRTEPLYLLPKALLILEQLNAKNVLTVTQKQWPTMIQQLLDRVKSDL